MKLNLDYNSKVNNYNKDKITTYLEFSRKEISKLEDKEIIDFKKEYIIENVPSLRFKYEIDSKETNKQENIDYRKFKLRCNHSSLKGFIKNYLNNNKEEIKGHLKNSKGIFKQKYKSIGMKFNFLLPDPQIDVGNEKRIEEIIIEAKKINPGDIKKRNIFFYIFVINSVLLKLMKIFPKSYLLIWIQFGI